MAFSCIFRLVYAIFGAPLGQYRCYRPEMHDEVAAQKRAVFHKNINLLSR